MKTILVDAVDCFVSETGEINKQMHEMLESFDNPKIIVTNAPDEMISEFGLDKVPYPVYSLKKNPMKTDPEYFKKFLEDNNIESEDVVYFEHNIEAVKSAESVGIKTYHFDHVVNDVEGVGRFIENNK